MLLPGKRRLLPKVCELYVLTVLMAKMVEREHKPNGNYVKHASQKHVFHTSRFFFFCSLSSVVFYNW